MTELPFTASRRRRAAACSDRADRRGLPWRDGRMRSGLLRERRRHDRLFSVLDGRPYLRQYPLPLGGNYIVARWDIQADRCIPNRGVTAHQLPGVGIDLHRAALEHQHAVILNGIPLAVDDEDAPWGKHRRTNRWELVSRRGGIQWGTRTNHQEQQRADESQPDPLPGAKTSRSFHEGVLPSR